jgi:tRNA (cmo5U34)-methyltransferase
MSSSEPPEALPGETDRLFSDQASAPPAFRFDEAVARVFPDMLRRSIPGYSALLHLIGVLAQQTVKDGTSVYDLGCSLGAVSLSIRHAIGPREARLIAIDNSQAMVDRCREVLSADSGLCPVEVFTADITDLSFEPSSLIVLNFTLQFVPPPQRQEILARIERSLVPGGVLVLSEKTAADDADVDARYRELHDAFRESNGYTRMEMSRKREALDQILIPEDPVRYEGLMREVGLVPIPWFRCLQFVSWIAKKPE